jgi:hypothetical protein
LLVDDENVGGCGTIVSSAVYVEASILRLGFLSRLKINGKTNSERNV